MNISYSSKKVRIKEDIEVIRPLVDKLFKLQADRAAVKWHEILAAMTVESRLYPDFEAEIFPYSDTQLIMVIDDDRNDYVGFAYTVMDHENKGCLKLFYLDEAYRGKGIGSKLFSDAMEFVNAHSPDEILIYVSDGNVPSLNFYMSKGFRFKSLVWDGMVTELTSK